jgi:2-amino-4-hydroxy-6-hydroxymethyldihydropteridine diphosphokinase
MLTDAFIGIGSNEGDRREYIKRALSLLGGTPGIRLVSCSSIYESPAHVLEGSAPQNDYYNAACLVETELNPADLLVICLQIEKQCGRIRTAHSRWESRTLDLDILLYGQQTIEQPDLSIPHERMAQRSFVLAPLAEIAPELHIPPPIDAPVQYLLANCPDTGALRTVIPRSSLLRDE